MSYIYKKTPKSDDSKKEVAVKKNEKTQTPTTQYSTMHQLAATIGNRAMIQLAKKEVFQKKSANNKTGLPDKLKTGIENISGISLDDVHVHYNSIKPAKVGALAYTQGTDIHVGSGQEKHLSHEAWHVVQQKQGRVKPTMQMKGNVSVNDDVRLEGEADVMGAKAIIVVTNDHSRLLEQEATGVRSVKNDDVMQLTELAENKLNVAGEEHSESDNRRDNEKLYAWETAGIDKKRYWDEHLFKYTVGDKSNQKRKFGDSFLLRIQSEFALIGYGTVMQVKKYKESTSEKKISDDEWKKYETFLHTRVNSIKNSIGMMNYYKLDSGVVAPIHLTKLTNIICGFNMKVLNKMKIATTDNDRYKIYELMIFGIFTTKKMMNDEFKWMNSQLSHLQLAALRSNVMMDSVIESKETKGLWKVGRDHISQMIAYRDEKGYNDKTFQIISQEEFNKGYDNWNEEQSQSSDDESLFTQLMAVVMMMIRNDLN